MIESERTKLKRTLIAGVLYLGVVALGCAVFPAKANEPMRYAVPEAKIYSSQELRRENGAPRTDMTQQAYQVDQGRMIVTEDRLSRCYLWIPDLRYHRISPTMSCYKKHG